jgi:CRISPR/Cas system-associated protein Cas7 (RAMP superfamily)
MKVKLEKKEISFEEIEIEFPFYIVEELVEDSIEMAHTEFTRITENKYTRISVKRLETNIVNFDRKFDYLTASEFDAFDFQEENKKSFNEALALLKENVNKL